MGRIEIDANLGNWQATKSESLAIVLQIDLLHCRLSTLIQLQFNHIEVGLGKEHNIYPALAIARAIAKNPDIYIFDDSFSALDFKTDAKLRQELNQLVKKTKSTVLLVGQRIASIMDADQIIVLDEGRIVGKGTHDELMKSCQVYQEIAYSQLSKEELSHE